MKKILLTIGATIGISVGVFAQGSLTMNDNSAPNFAALNTDSIDSSSATGWYTGNATLELFTLAGGATAGQQTAINNSWADPLGAIALLNSDGFVQQTIGGSSSVSVSVNGGDFNIGTQTIGDSGSLTSGSTVSYALLAWYTLGDLTYEGILAMNPSTAGTPSPGTPANLNSIWAGTQNLYLAPVPEPATIALAGLSGLSLLLFRRRKA